MSSRLNNLQVLRAFAAMSVVVFHSGYLLGPLKPFGSYGVDVFFVISGYIMASICDKRPRNFLKRRIIRIVPLYWLATLFLFALAKARPEWVKATEANWSQLWKSLLFIPFFKSNGLIQPMLFVGWSLNYEMYFYLLLALGLLVAGKRAPWLASAVVIAVPIALYFAHPQSAPGQFFQNVRSYEFVLGVLTYYVTEHISARASRQLRWPLATASLLCIAWLIVWHSLSLPEGIPVYLINGLPGVILVAASVLTAKAGADTNLTFLVLLGDASYAMYLLHPYVLYLQERVLARRAHVLSSQFSLFGMLLSCLLVIAISIATYKWIEKPMVDWLGRKFAPNPRSPQPVLAENPL